jgi:hypothetical protein
MTVTLARTLIAGATTATYADGRAKPLDLNVDNSHVMVRSGQTAKWLAGR